LHDPTALSYSDIYTFPGVKDEDIGIVSRAEKAKDGLLKDWRED